MNNTKQRLYDHILAENIENITLKYKDKIEGLNLSTESSEKSPSKMEFSFTEEEYLNFLQIQSAQNLKKIKNFLLFFVILTIIGISAGLIWLIVLFG